MRYICITKGAAPIMQRRCEVIIEISTAITFGSTHIKIRYIHYILIYGSTYLHPISNRMPFEVPDVLCVILIILIYLANKTTLSWLMYSYTT